MTHTADLGDQARGHAADLVGKAKETAHRSVRDATDQARQHVAGEVHGAAEAAQAAANSFDSNGMQAQAAQVIATQRVAQVVKPQVMLRGTHQAIAPAVHAPAAHRAS